MKLHFWDREPEEHETSIFSLFTVLSQMCAKTSEMSASTSFFEYETVKWSETNLMIQFDFVLICKGNNFQWKDILWVWALKIVGCYIVPVKHCDSNGLWLCGCNGWALTYTRPKKNIACLRTKLARRPLLNLCKCQKV